MAENSRANLTSARSIVIKLGTQLLTAREGGLNGAFLAGIAQQVAMLRANGARITLVSSGAVGCGLKELNLVKRPTDLSRLQATAAVGQRKLMDGWADAFEPHKLPVAQLLITREDMDDRTRFLNVRNTIAAAHELGAVPIINENDTISTDEIVRITFGDNDLLAAAVASTMRADLLILLSVVDGVLDREGKAVRDVTNLDDARALLRAEKSALGKGGMNSKFDAARMMTDAGESLVVADGRMENVLIRIVAGEEIGTLFSPAKAKRSSRSRWIGAARPNGAIVVDEGAAKALMEKNRSLLPAGIVKVSGDFDRGDVVTIQTREGAVVARGLTNYTSGDVVKIAGKKTAEVRAMLAEAAYDEVVHRDNLVVERR